MSLSKDFITLSFREYATLLGQDESMSILTDMFKKVTVAEEKPKEEEPKQKKKTTKNEDDNRRVKMITKTYSSLLEKELEAVHKTADKKEFDKLKQDLKDYLNNLSDTDYNAKKIDAHIKDFVASRFVVETKPTLEERVDRGELATTASSSNEITDVSLKELQQLEMVTTPTGKFQGVLYDCDNGRYVRGPPSDDEEELDEKTFNNQKYDVGRTTGRVYRIEYIGSSTDDYKHIFEGFVNVGKFKGMK